MKTKTISRAKLVAQIKNLTKPNVNIIPRDVDELSRKTFAGQLLEWVGKN